MLELILHHTYKLDGEAVDLSRHHNHGYRTDVSYVADGREPGSGALLFDAPHSRVHVPYAPIWDHPGALRIDAWVKLEAPGAHRMIAVGQNSFAFFVEADGVLGASFTLPRSPGGPPMSGRLDSARASPDGVRHTVPVGTWTRLGFLHDGFSSARLYIDGTLVAGAYILRSPVLSVGPAGVSIGHGLPGAGSALQGQIDEIRIWRYDPRTPMKQFFCRPLDDSTWRCWNRALRALSAIAQDEGQRALLWGWQRCLLGSILDTLRTVRGRGERAIAECDEFGRRYLKLWCSGRMDGPEMRDFARDWVAWLESALGPDGLRQLADRVRGCQEQYRDLDLSNIFGPLADCDPRFVAYLGLFGEQVGKERQADWFRDAGKDRQERH
jgi:hypothetical protein